MSSVADVIVIVAGYLWGSLSPSAFIARRARGVDLSRYGTGNVGSSNLGELLGGSWKIVGFLGGRGIAAAAGVLSAWDVRFIVVVPLVVGVGWITGRSALTTIIVVFLLAPVAWLLHMPRPVVTGCAAVTLLLVAKRLEANRLPLPSDRLERRAVLWRRLWSDRDLSGGQPWEKRGRFD